MIREGEELRLNPKDSSPKYRSPAEPFFTYLPGELDSRKKGTFHGARSPGHIERFGESLSA